jgi:hypothetical protein
MAEKRTWKAYPDSYRAKEMALIAQWIAVGESGSVVGLAGCGRSNLLGFLCHRPEVLQMYLSARADPVVIIPVDLNNLPAHDVSTLYRTILHAFYWVRDNFEPGLQQAVTQLYLENRAVQDPFLSQRVLYDLLLLFQNQQLQVVLVLNRFDRFCQVATPPMLNTLRGLRDSFKDTLCYLVGMVRDVIYLPNPQALGDMYDLLDSHVCWVGAMSETDARQMLEPIVQRATPPPTEAEIGLMLNLSGCFPVLLKAIAQWWLFTLNRPASMAEWKEVLLEESNLQYRLERMWLGLTQEEQLALSEVQKLQAMTPTETLGGNQELPRTLKKSFQTLSEQQRPALIRLAAKGLCYPKGGGWWINGGLLAAHVANVEGRIRGRIWLDEETKAIYQGQALIEDLTALQYEILRFFVKNPRGKHTRDDIIDNAWPEEDQREGITPNALQVHIASIRKKIEPNPAQPRYLITWHGRPGGYQFFPEGKPE